MGLPTDPSSIRLEHIHLTYGAFHALKDLSLTLNPAEVHAIVGEHGAGKSSLAHILSGFLKPDSGNMIINDMAFTSLTPEIARKRGIEIVTQHTPLLENFSIAENIVLTHNIGILPLLSGAGSIRKVRAFLQKFPFDIDPTLPVKSLNLSDRALIDLLKHLYPEPRLLILDETLEKLSNENRHKARSILRDLKTRGLSILAITHRIDEIYDFADRVTILRDGEKLMTDSVENIDKITLIRLAYTQVLAEKQIQDDQSFARILKYNEAILSHLPLNLIVIDKEYRIKLVNKAAETLFGLADGGDKDRLLWDILGQNNPNMLELIRLAAAQRQHTAFYQIPLQLPAAVTINNLIVDPIFDGNLLIGSLIIIEDITLQEKLREQMALSENLASVGLLAAGVAHEINNPLDIMSYYLEHLRFHSQDPTVLDAAQNLDEEIQSIAQIVGNLITFSDKKRVTSDIFNVNDLIRDLMNLLAYNAAQNSIAIRLNLPSQAAQIDANRNEIKQVFLNLVKNSMEAMPEGGTLTITVTINVHTLDIIFEDTGAGIDDAQMNEIFLPFYSTKHGSATNVGLGLSISYGIIKKYTGAITVKNREPNGCQFTITLPLAA